MITGILASMQITLPIASTTPTISNTPSITIGSTPVITGIVNSIAKATPSPSSFSGGSNIFEITTLILTTILGVLAFYMSYKANQLSKLAIEQSKATLEHEKFMRRLENRIGVNDKILEIYEFFIKEATSEAFLARENIEHSVNKLSSIECSSQILFDDETFCKIHNNILQILDILTEDKIPPMKELRREYDKLNCKDNIDNMLELFITEKEKQLQLFRVLLKFRANEIFEKYRFHL